MKNSIKKILLVAIAVVMALSLVACGECQHQFDNGACTKCNQPCTHQYSNGVCTICNKVCTTHNYVDGTCTICNKSCNTHNYVNGVCTICNKVCTHTYDNGACTVCQKVCNPHNYVDAFCTICNKACPHAYVNGVCTICSLLCSHNYDNGVCIYCNLACNHAYTNGVCSNCNKACNHSFSQGFCAECSLPCNHNFSQGACTICQLACQHNYVNSTCTVCNLACPHNYYYGVCRDCGNVCSHVYQDSACVHCDVVCTSHTWVQGYCAICSIKCNHNYDNGVCTNCNYNCAHFYVSGVCTNCGKKDPNYVAPDSSLAKYQPVIESYKTVIAYKRNTTQMPPRGDNEPYFYDLIYKVVENYNPTDDFGYAVKDINGDGTDELVLLDSNFQVYGLLTLVADVPTVVGYLHGMGAITSWGDVYYTEKIIDGTNYYNIQHIKKLVGANLVGLEYMWLDTDGDLATNDDMVYYHVVDGVKEEITKDKYSTYTNNYDYYMSYKIRLTRLSGLWYKSALTSPATSLPTADFSTYQTAIQTFSTFYNQIAKGTLDKTKWTGNTYASSMLFDTEADYQVFNKLVASLVLVKESGWKNATFGYALRDLNGDGKDELIFMECTGYVLAIFTEVDGKAVLLDSYNDSRTAFIDANGKIHVQTRLLPGNKKDVRYDVLTIQGGKLVSTLTVSVLHVRNGYKDQPNSWHKVVGGQTVDIDQTEFDTLYSQWAGDLGTMDFNAYTYKNAQLTFVKI